MSIKANNTLRIGIVLYPNVLRSSVYGLQELFLVANNKANEQEQLSGPLFDVQCWSDEENELIADSQQMRRDGIALDLLIVPPAMGEQPPANISPTMKQWLSAQHDKGCIFASACVGAFVLAAAGILQDRTCTTHWGLATKLSQQDTSINIDTDKILIDDGDGRVPKLAGPVPNLLVLQLHIGIVLQGIVGDEVDVL